MDVVVWWMILITLITNVCMFAGYIYTAQRIQSVATNTLFTMLRSKETRKQLIQLFMNKDTTDIVAEELFSRLKAGLYGMVGQDKKAEKKVMKMIQDEATDAALQESGLGGLLSLLPERMRKSLEENPQLLAAGLRILGPMLQQRYGMEGGGSNIYP
jgi:hypothetical protein